MCVYVYVCVCPCVCVFVGVSACECVSESACMYAHDHTMYLSRVYRLYSSSQTLDKLQYTYVCIRVCVCVCVYARAQVMFTCGVYMFYNFGQTLNKMLSKNEFIVEHLRVSSTHFRGRDSSSSEQQSSSHASGNHFQISLFDTTK